MSQKKVDAYKEYKKDRKNNIKKEKRQARVEISIFVAVACVFVGWFGWSVYHQVTKPDTSEETTATTTTQIDMTDYMNYVSGLQTGYTEG